MADWIVYVRLGNGHTQRHLIAAHSPDRAVKLAMLLPGAVRTTGVARQAGR